METSITSVSLPNDTYLCLKEQQNRCRRQLSRKQESTEILLGRLSDARVTSIPSRAYRRSWTLTAKRLPVVQLPGTRA